MFSRPVALIILDGWGCAPPGKGNAVSLAETPVFDDLLRRYPNTEIEASGLAVGLPDGQMGNSEVGHLTIGAGRAISQDLVRVNNSIFQGNFFDNEVLVSALDRAVSRQSKIHVIGLASHGGVHSHIDHIRAIADAASRRGVGDMTYFHVFTDGRDVSPTSAASDIADLINSGLNIATICGRYWAMDRDGRSDRTDRAFSALRVLEGTVVTDVVQAIRDSYKVGKTDEFIEPLLVAETPRIANDDVVIFANFRPDRARQISDRFIELNIDLTTMTRYSPDFACPVLFDNEEVQESLGEVISVSGLSQLRVAETEKYAHVTYFLNGGREEPWFGETRIFVPSPAEVSTYDEKPEMSALEVAAQFESTFGEVNLGVVNFANPDMVGHTGCISAVVSAVEVVDSCLEVVLNSVYNANGIALVFADHGNAETMLEADGISPNTAHTSNPVPLVVTSTDISLRERGSLVDIAPTVLELFGLPVPAKMTGKTLIVRD